MENYIRQNNALTTNRFVQKDKERGRGIDDKRRDVPKRRQDRSLEAMNKHRWERKEQWHYKPYVPAEVTPLNVSRAEVLMTIQDKDYVQWPKPLKTNLKRRDRQILSISQSSWARHQLLLSADP